MYSCHNLLSEYTQRALLVLCALLHEYQRRGHGVFKTELDEITGFPASALGRYVATLISHGLIGYGKKRRLVPGRRLNEATLYDLIACMDGWVHIGNACMDNMTGDLTFGLHIRSCEAAIRSGLDDYLRSIPLSSLLPSSEGKPNLSGVFDGRCAVGSVNLLPVNRLN